MARSRSTRWYAALIALVVAVLLAWLLGGVLPLTDGERVMLRVGLLVLGLVAAGALLWFLRPDEGPEIPVADPGGDDALAAIASARARMPRGAFDSRPLVLVAGPAGSCKTSVVIHSGMDPEILAGDPVRTDEAAPSTVAANLWAAPNVVFAEPGGDVFADAARWKKFVRALRTPRIAAAVGRQDPPPRAIALCVSCDMFYAGDGGAQLQALGQLARDRLAEASRELGVALPVYVLFTKADRIPHFEPWVAPLTRDEVRAPIGASLPFDSSAAATGKAARAAAAGGYAERMQPRIAAAFDTIVAALAARRIEFLGREAQMDRRLAAYEVPRGISKLIPSAERFLAEICRPTQLGVGPQLRGFYFIGARPVLVTDATSASAPAAAPKASRGAVDATSVFAALAAPPKGAAPAARNVTTRRVPQWVFLDRIFPDVVLADKSAAMAGRGGTRVSSLRRGALIAGIAVMVIVSVGFLISDLGNRGLLQRTTDAARNVAALPVIAAPAGTIAFPSADALGRLDVLRAMLDTIRTYQTSHVPMHLRWGLWRGDTVLADGTRVWFDGYHREMHAAAWSALVDSLRALPAAPRPTDDYGRDYAMLKAYLVMTAEAKRSTAVDLSPTLLSSWSRGQTLDADIAALARRQFEFYANALPVTNPWPLQADAQLVGRTRSFLARFTGADQIYQNMLTEANKAVPVVSIAAEAPQSAGVLAARADMPGAFTTAGWKFMQNAFSNADRYFQGESWVVGDAAAIGVSDRERTVAGLRARYKQDYIQQWRGFIRTMAVTRPTTTHDAAQKLGVLGGAQSPLLADLAMIARNTTVDSSIAAAFQPVHAVTPPGPAGKNIGDANQGYANALVTLQASVEQVANTPPATDSASATALSQAAQQALGPVTQARVAARTLSQKFAVDTAAAQISSTIASLLLAPIDQTEAVLRGTAATRAPAKRVVAGGGAGGAAPPAAGAAVAAAPAATGEDPTKLAALLNERGRALCTAITPMLAKFPFSPEATTDATLAEVTAALAPGTGSLWAFQQERLTGILEKQGNDWVVKPDARVGLSAPFVTFFNRAAQVSQALFAGGAEPHLALTVHATATKQMQRVTLTHGAQIAQFDQATAPAQLVWPPAAGREAKLSALVAGRFRSTDRLIAQASGDWALFRLVASAPTSQATGGALHAEWPIKEENVPPLAVDFIFPSGFPVLRRGWLGGMACTPQVTK